jgi:hypothetical protein
MFCTYAGGVRKPNADDTRAQSAHLVGKMLLSTVKLAVRLSEVLPSSLVVDFCMLLAAAGFVLCVSKVLRSTQKSPTIYFGIYPQTITFCIQIIIASQKTKIIN